MSSNSSKSTVDRIFDWVRGFFAQGANQLDRSPQQRQELPDLDATESDYEYTGEPSDATRPPEQAGTGGPASEAAERIVEYRSDQSDLDDAQGRTDEDDLWLPQDSTDPNEVYHVHHAVGGDEDVEDDGTDGRIDTERDLPFDRNTTNLSGQNPGSAAGGASADEFAHGGYEPTHAEPEEVEAAAEGEPTEMEDDTSTSDTGNLEQHAGAYAGSQTIEDVGFTAGSVENAPETGVGEERTDLSGTDTATREEIELANRGDAFSAFRDVDQALTAPGQSDPEDFDDVTLGTTEASRSATGNDLEEGPDALGTTLDYSEESSETFDPDAANLSGEEEMSVSDLEAGAQPGSISGQDSTRLTTFRSGTIAEEELAGETGTQDEVDTPEQPYADLPDEPHEVGSQEESGLDDFSGSDYPSDRRVDRLAGDDPFDAQQPDIGQEGSSAGDLSAPEPTDELLISEETPPEAAEPGVSRGTVFHQEAISTADDSIGNEPSSTELATGAVEGMAFDEESMADRTASLQEAEATGTQATPQALADDGGAGSASTRADDAPAGAVRGDGTTSTPPGYPVKGNANSMIYHLPSFPSYGGTKPEFCFATEQDAINAGYRAPGKRNRGRQRS
ncbi:MAG: hypothetical protein M3173_02865 [Chloroflexota bacterium]|nr:hypothetical protein [Chloroflexota bacterium]